MKKWILIDSQKLWQKGLRPAQSQSQKEPSQFLPARHAATLDGRWPPTDAHDGGRNPSVNRGLCTCYARKEEVRVRGVQGRGHLRARKEEVLLQAVRGRGKKASERASERGRGHLRARKEEVRQRRKMLRRVPPPHIIIVVTVDYPKPVMLLCSAGSESAPGKLACGGGFSKKIGSSLSASLYSLSVSLSSLQGPTFCRRFCRY
jgi:hypothetical protein